MKNTINVNNVKKKIFSSKTSFSPLNYSAEEKKLDPKIFAKTNSFETKSLKEKLTGKKDLIGKFKFEKKILSINDNSLQNLSERGSFKITNKKSPVLNKLQNQKHNIFTKSL